MPNKPKRENPVSAYLDHGLKKQAMAVARKQKRSLSRLIEESLAKAVQESGKQ